MLRVSLFGGVSIKIDGEEITNFASAKTVAIFTYLLCNSGVHNREALATKFWDDRSQDRAMGNLRVALSSLRKTLGDYLHITRQTISINTESNIDLDVEVFEAGVRRWAYTANPEDSYSPEFIRGLANALENYQGDFLAGFYVPESRDFDAWLVLERERLHHLAESAYEALVEHYLQSWQISEGLGLVDRWIDLDPFQEKAHRVKMNLLIRDGQFEEALRQYEVCREILQQELGVYPSPVTEAFYQRILSAGPLQVQLPAPFTSFVGRSKERRSIIKLLSNPAFRLLTIVGPGGIGKTRLAIRCAEESAKAFLNGVYFIDLTTIQPQSSDNLASALANVFGISFVGRDSMQDQLINYLREKETLLVLDNFEDTMDDTPVVDAILRGASGVKMLVTSRERLNLTMERLFMLEGLAYPGRESAPFTVDDSLFDGAVLFENSANRVKPDFSIDNSNIASIRRICELVEGMPLGIEIAASWVRALAPRDIVLEIETSLDFLENTSRNVPLRHKSLRAVFDYSWAELSEKENITLERLSVFRGGFTRDAAREIVGATPLTLLNLVDKSLLGWDVAERRYRLHEMLIQYAGEKLNERGSKDEMRQKHAAYYADYLASRGKSLRGEGQKSALAEINEEIGNIRAAWNWMVQRCEDDLLEVALDSFYLFFEMRSAFYEGADLFLQGMQACERSEALYFRLRARLGRFYFRLGRYEEAETLLSESVDFAEKAGEELEMAFGYASLGNAVHYRKDPQKALEYYQKGLVIFEAKNDHWGISRTLNSIGVALRSLGDYEGARDSLLRGLAISREMENQWGVAMYLNSLGILSRIRGEYQEAKTYYNESLVIKEAFEDRRGIAISYNNLGNIAVALNEQDEARAFHKQSLALCREIGDRMGMARSLNNLGALEFTQENYAEARTFHLQSLQIKREMGDRVGEIHSHTHLGDLYLKAGNMQKAREHYQSGMHLAKETGNVPLFVFVLAGMADVLRQGGNTTAGLMIASFVKYHDATGEQTREKAGDIIAEMIAEIPGVEAEALIGKGVDYAKNEDGVNKILAIIDSSH